ncbi:TonB-dependent receptor [Methylicorpusculum sp.]|uniref:TonB-dependent receptor n=1 Tax=Methylicorpusculum sp. TaxID=2713644 RepID=UPI002736F289|nr:TonB-dependent receptor [Methylicorpusculum sp.]MDP3528555.1 TonB-dependent receptor [Methylicorpusculum sp.]MDZ4150158.1 TonB-dependent receptor [Methylicorpusculum sp.]
MTIENRASGIESTREPELATQFPFINRSLATDIARILAYRKPNRIAQAKRHANSAAMIVTGVCLLGSGVGFAQEIPAHLEAEITRLRQELEASKQENQSLKKAITGEKDPALEESLAEPQNPEESLTEEVAVDEDRTDDLGEVVVRAQPRLKKLKDVPASTSVRSGEELSRELAFDLEQILKRSGNAKFDPGNARTSSLSLRGLGKQSLVDAMDPSIGTVMDGVPYLYNPLASFDHYDLAQVAVDRGPTGTDFGKNFNMGRIAITPRHPSFAPDANFSLTYGEYESYIADAAGGGTVIDNLLAWRGAIHVNKADGAYENLSNPRDTFYNRDRAAGRVQLLFTPTEDFSARISFDANTTQKESFNGNTFFDPLPSKFANGTPNTTIAASPEVRLNRRWFRDGKPNYTLDNYFRTDAFDQDSAQPTESSSKGGLVDLNWNIGDVKLASITAVRDFEFRAANDEGTPFDVNRGGDTGGHVPRFLHFSQEFRVSSKFEDMVDYQAGALYLKRDMDYNNWTSFGKDAGAWYASDAQYARLDADANGRNLMADSSDGLIRWRNRNIENDTAGIFGQGEWHVTDAFNITTGARVNYEKRKLTTNQILTDSGKGSALNRSAVNGIQLGGFDTNNNGVLTASALADPNQVAAANAAAQQYFNQATYAALTNAQRAQVGAAKSIRNGRIGNLWDYQKGVIEDVQPAFIVSPSYKFNENLTSYVSWRFSQKPGFLDVPNGFVQTIEEETANSFEIGFKSNLFGDTLALHTDFFWTEIDDYQQPALIYDEFTTNIDRSTNPNAPPVFISGSGNAAGVRIMGVEIDGSYTGIPYTSINFSGAWNDAVYTDFKNAIRPVEQRYPGAPTSYDATGENLPGAAQFTFNISPEVRYPLAALGWGKAEFHTSFTTAYTSAYNSDNALSVYGNIKANTTTDFSVGVGRSDKLFDVSLVGKNIFDNQEPIARTWNTWSPNWPQWFGVRVSSSF